MKSNLKDVLSDLDTLSGDITLVDGDIVAYRFATLNTDEIDWGDGNVTTIDDVKRALGEAQAFVNYLKDQCNGTPILFFTGDNNFRKHEFLEYKANRPSHEKPKMLDVLKDKLAEVFYSVRHDDLEADDLLGIFQTHPSLKGRTIIATIDKDLDQIDGWHYNWNHERTYNMTIQEGRQYFWTQVLTGDATDNYKGCHLVGPKGASELLEDNWRDTDCFPIVYKAYIEREMKRQDHHTYPTHDFKYLLSQIRCALMLTYDMFDFNTNKPVMWEPNWPSYKMLSEDGLNEKLKELMTDG
jgi:5'-3' exonuclease